MNWRPHNETPGDLEREQRAAREVSEAWECEVTKLSETLYGIDWCLSRGQTVIAFGEFKSRDQRYDTLILSAAKWQKLTAWTLPGCLFIRWADAPIEWVDTGKLGDLPLRMGGNNRGQNGDIEPVVHIPRERFRPLRNQPARMIAF